MSDTIAAIATGIQISAIGIIRISGPETINIINKLFTPYSKNAMKDANNRQLVFGQLHDREGRLLDVCLCTVSRGPGSYTGEDTAELQCHGSPVVLRAALEELFALGARQADPGEFTKRAFLNGRMGLVNAEAVVDIIDAETIEAARNAAGQLSGAISARIDALYDQFADICSHYHAVLDYPDEDIEDFQLSEYEHQIRSAETEMHKLLATYDRGRLMNSGIPTVIIGVPNAGKSSLLNRLLGYERAIVTQIPGTTRDTIEEKLRIGSLTLRLTDTAGIRDTDDVVEQLGVERSKKALENAELVIAVIDGSKDISDEDREIINFAEASSKAIIVLSKNDICSKAEVITSLPVVSLSSISGDGISNLEDTISSLFPLPFVPAGEILTNARQADAVKRAAASMSDALSSLECGMTPDIVLTQIEDSMVALGELNGKTVREDVTNRIFSRFCVGK